ncbi:hypothetical protein AKJ16_DCAP16394 [Drosera capensis]
MGPGGPGGFGPGGPGGFGPGGPGGFGPGGGPGGWGPPGGPGFGPGGPGFWGPGPGLGGCFNGICDMFYSCFSCLCCCWLLRDCFGGPRPYGGPPGGRPF